MNRSWGFTLLELIIVIALMGIMASVITVSIRPRPANERKEFLASLNALLALGWREALITRNVHKIEFDFAKNSVVLQKKIENESSKSGMQFIPVKSKYTENYIKWPKNLEVQQFLIEGKNEMGGLRKEAVWFYIMPDGSAQDIIINLIDVKDKMPNKQSRQVGWVLNPFSVQFTEYGSFQK